MYKNITIVIGITILFLGTCITPSVANNSIEQSFTPTFKGKTLYVGGSGEGNYSKIQDAINDTMDGDTVYVFNGLYNESVNIDKSIDVIGEDKYSTIIDGQKKRARVVKLRVDGITFSGFSVIHSRDWANDAGIYIYSSYNVIKNNIIKDNKGGEGGIAVDGDYNLIYNNIVRKNGEFGIFIGYQDHYNVISGNIIENHYRGMWLAADHGNVVANNYISNNSNDGIMIRGVEDYDVHDNIIENNNGAAIRIEWDASNVLVYSNIIKNNGEGLVINDATYITVAGNSFYVSGIRLKGNKLDHWISHKINNNTINGRSINYFKSKTDLVVPSNTSQLILGDCSNCSVKDLHISNVYYGIQLGFSNGNNIVSNEFNDNVGPCIFITSSSNNVIDSNLIINTIGTGIVIGGNSQNNEITKNNILNNTDGIKIGEKSSLNIICDNNIENNENRGVYLVGSENKIYRNNFKQNYWGVILDFSYNNSIFENNFIRNNFLGSFRVDYTRIHDNNWDKNYYSFYFRIFPKIIWGRVKTKYYWIPGDNYKMYIYRHGINFDWNPAEEPYDIEV